MPRHAPARNDNLSVAGDRLEYVSRTAAVAAILFDPLGAEALLDIPDAEVGRLFKTHLMKIIGVASALNMDVSAIREEDEKQSNRTKRRGWEFPGLSDCSAANIERYSLVLQGKLLPVRDFCQAAGITERRLSKDVASGRLFSVEFEGEPYYPAFVLSDLFERKDFARVVRRLGESSGWSKWIFFTTSLNSLTPLQLLMRKEVKRVLKAVEDLGEQ